MHLREIAVFGSLALGVHIAAWSVTSGTSGATSAGRDGADEVTLIAATASQAAMVSTWQRAPEATTQPPPELATPTLDAPTLPKPAAQSNPSPGLRLPESTPTLSAPQRALTPDIDTEAAAPPVRMAASKRPKPRPDKREVFAPSPTETRQQPRKVAQGSGSSQQAGQDNASDLQSANAARANALRAQWGASIYAKIRRNMQYPRGLNDDGTARLALRVASNGRLQDLRLTRSSGNAAIDRAALRAVSRAGRFNKAPQGLSGSSHDFSLSLTFTR